MKNVKMSRALIASALVFVGIGTPAEAPCQERATETSPTSFTVLAEFPLGGQHVVKLVEYAPGITGVVETGVPVLGTPVVPRLKKASVTELYRRFAGRRAAIPESVIAADLRATAAARESIGKNAGTPPSTGPSPVGWNRNVNSGGSLYTWDEVYDWFYPTYCIQYDAKYCDLNYDGSFTQTPPVSYSSACGFVGSEGSSYAGFQGMYWDSSYGTWIPVIDDSIPPGWAYCFAMTSNVGPLYLEWDMWGAGYGTTIGFSVYY